MLTAMETPPTQVPAQLGAGGDGPRIQTEFHSLVHLLGKFTQERQRLIARGHLAG